MAKKQSKQTATIDPAQLDTYYKQRMYQMGITNPEAHFYIVEGEHPMPDRKQPIFTESAAGDVEINYPSLYGGPELIAGGETPFQRKRIQHPTEPDRKYYQDPKSGVHIFFPPLIIEKFAKKEKIKTLFLVEGEFKAMAASLTGLEIIGLGGMSLFTDGEKSLHKDIREVIRYCEVDNIVLLLDADVKFITWNKEDEPGKDLSKRLYNFYNAVCRFREVAKDLVRDCYFMHVSEELLSEAKGLDDLLFLQRQDGEKAVNACIEDLLKLTAARRYFDGYNLSQWNRTKLKSIFYLNFLKGVPEAFYDRFDGLIGDLEFNFSGGRYQHTRNGGLKMVKHEDSFKFIRLGCDYFKTIHVPNAKGILQRKMEPWKKGEITMDYVHIKGIKNFFETIETYDAICSVPCNDESYEQVVHGCYNMYYKLDHELEAGEWPMIEKFLKHIFGAAKIASGESNYIMGLDWLTIIYRKPTQNLPIIALVNRENNTGKSTFMWLLEAMFQNNYTEIGNEELKDHLNDDWASKLVIAIDEGFIDKKVVYERIKALTTGHTIKLRGMYAGRKTIPFYGKFVFASNDEDNFAPLADEDTRCWVNKVPVLTDKDPKMLEKMKDELPAFLHYLANREIVHPDAGRLWFHEDLIDTEAGRNVKKNSRGWAYDEISEVIADLFIHYQYPTLRYTVTELSAVVNKGDAGTKFRKGDLKKQLKNKFKLNPTLPQRYEFPHEPDAQQNGLSITYEKIGRYYEFRIEDFYPESEIRRMKNKLGQQLFDYDQIIKSRTARPDGDDDNDDMPF